MPVDKVQIVQSKVGNVAFSGDMATGTVDFFSAVPGQWRLCFKSQDPLAIGFQDVGTWTVRGPLRRVEFAAVEVPQSSAWTSLDVSFLESGKVVGWGVVGES